MEKRSKIIYVTVGLLIIVAVVLVIAFTVCSCCHSGSDKPFTSPVETFDHLKKKTCILIYLKLKSVNFIKFG